MHFLYFNKASHSIWELIYLITLPLLINNLFHIFSMFWRDKVLIVFFLIVFWRFRNTNDIFIMLKPPLEKCSELSTVHQISKSGLFGPEKAWIENYCQVMGTHFVLFFIFQHEIPEKGSYIKQNLSIKLWQFFDDQSPEVENVAFVDFLVQQVIVDRIGYEWSGRFCKYFFHEASDRPFTVGLRVQNSKSLKIFDFFKKLFLIFDWSCNSENSFKKAEISFLFHSFNKYGQNHRHVSHRVNILNSPTFT